jgi:hypothetical protein
MSKEIIQDESSNVTEIPIDFDHSLLCWVDPGNKFCRVDEELDKLTLIWDWSENCFHYLFLYRIGLEVSRKCNKRFMAHKRSVHWYKTTVKRANGIYITLEGMLPAASKVKRLRGYDRKLMWNTADDNTRKCGRIFNSLNSITAEYVNCSRALLSVNSGRHCGKPSRLYCYCDTHLRIKDKHNIIRSLMPDPTTVSFDIRADETTSAYTVAEFTRSEAVAK